MRVYLDNSAATKPYSEVSLLVKEVMDGTYGNPSALHDEGLAAEKLLKEARRRVADAVGAETDSLIFTSGGTEADNMALLCGAESGKRRGKRIISSRIEHPAVIETCKALAENGFDVVFADVDKGGAVLPSSVENAINEETILIACMHVNNETGVVQPVGELLRLRDDFERRTGKRILFFVDAVQSFGKIPLDFGVGISGNNNDEARRGDFFRQYCENFNNIQNSPGGVDLIALSAHKIHGPKGAGALYVKRGVNVKPLIFGGGQERGLRSGTENVPAIAGFGLAAKMTSDSLGEKAAHAAKLRNRLLHGLMSEVSDIRINGAAHTTFDNAAPGEYLNIASPYILNVSFMGVKGEVLLHDLEMKGVFVSTGSACSSKKKGGSPVLKAMGLSQAAIEGAVRFSLGAFNTAEDIDYTVAVVKDSVARFRRLGRFR
jgi:cysteine desulfurase